MNPLRNRVGGIAFAAATLLMFAPNALACSSASGIALRSANLADPFLKIILPRPNAADIAKPTPAQRASDPASIQGLWQVTYTSGGQVVDMAFEVFHSDGTEMLNDITPPAEGNVCLGVWTQMTSTDYKLTHPSWLFDASGNLTGTATFDVSITLSSADKFTGTYTLSYFDLKGNPGPKYTGAMTATRVLPGY